MNRRQFISKSAAALALSGLVGSEAFASVASAPNKGRIGIQLYSVREDLNKDFLGTLKKLSAMGYSQVEPYGFTSEKFLDKYTMKELSKIVGDMGMIITSAHTNSAIFPEDINAPQWDYWKKCSEYLLSGGAKFAAHAGYPGDRNTLSDVKRTADHFNRIGQVCKKAGIRFAFHNHARELAKVEGEVLLEYLIKNTDPSLVSFQLDMGHAVNGGGDPYRLLQTYKGRFPMWHASDYHAINKTYTLLGQGSAPYPAMFEIADSSGLEILTIEQERTFDVLTACKADFDYLKQFKWTQVL